MPALNEIKRGAAIGRRSHGIFIWTACETCGMERWVLLLRGKPKSRLCHSCANCAYGADGTRINPPGTFRRRGYIFVYKPDHPSAVKGYVKRAVLVLETKLGRYLAPGTISHHVNGIRDDDYPENLEELSISAHVVLHNKDKESTGRKRDSHGRYLPMGRR